MNTMITETERFGYHTNLEDKPSSRELYLDIIKKYKRFYFIQKSNGSKIELFHTPENDQTFITVKGKDFEPDFMGSFTFNHFDYGSVEITSIHEGEGYQGVFITILNDYLIRQYDYVILNLFRDRGYAYFLNLLLANKSDLCSMNLIVFDGNCIKYCGEDIFHLLKSSKDLTRYKILIKSNYEII